MMKLPDDDLKRSKYFGVVLSILKCFKWKLYRCICWLIVEVIFLIFLLIWAVLHHFQIKVLVWSNERIRNIFLQTTFRDSNYLNVATCFINNWNFCAEGIWKQCSNFMFGTSE